MVERDAEATKRRLLEAATAEFAAYGIAGARVDRIATAARSNKAQIYHYFGSKDGLFDTVFGNTAKEAAEDDYFDGNDLGETAGHIFDSFESSPEVGRLALWYRLERAGDARTIAALAEANETKIAAIVAAQRSGIVTDSLPADVILGMMLMVASTWTALPADFQDVTAHHSSGARRGFVVDAVRRIVAP